MPFLMERKITMTINQMLDLAVTLAGVALVIVVAVYTKYKIQIDKKAQQGDLIAKAEQVVARAVEPLVYQAEKNGGAGEAKFNWVLNALLTILDLAHLPHPTKEYLSGEIEKGVTAMKQTQGLINSLNNKGEDAK